MKIGDIINLPSVQAFSDSLTGTYPEQLPWNWANSMTFTDSYAGTILARQLTAINPKIFEKKYPELSFILSGIEADNIGGYAQLVQSLRVLENGGFTISGDPSGNKGKISLTAESNFIMITGLETSATWTTTEIKQAELNNINLPSKYIEAINKVYQRGVDKIGLLGGVGTQAASKGLLNHTGFTGTAASAITGLTAQQMYDAYADAITSQRNAVNNTPGYACNRVITPVYAINELARTVMNTANASNISALGLLKQNFPDVEFFGSFRCDDAAGSGVSASVFFSNSPDVMTMRIPIPLTIGEIIRKGSFDFSVDAMYRVGGLDVLENTGGYILTAL
jgi:hypothetical protein